MKHLSNEQRSQIIALKLAGKTWKQVISLMERNHQCTVTKNGCQKLFKKFETTGSIKDKRRSGRPIKFSRRTERVI